MTSEKDGFWYITVPYHTAYIIIKQMQISLPAQSAIRQESHLKHDVCHQLGMRLLTRQKLGNHFVHHVLWRKEIHQECWQNPCNNTSLVRITFPYSILTTSNTNDKWASHDRRYMQETVASYSTLYLTTQRNHQLFTPLRHNHYKLSQAENDVT